MDKYLQQASSPEEIAVFFQAGRETLLGVLTEPVTEGTATGVLLAPGGGTPSTSTERNGVFVALARALAQRGYRVFRLDWHGVGDSTGEVLAFRLEKPFREDLTAACAFLRSNGVQRLVVVGSCFGARTALAAHSAIDDLQAFVLIAPPVRDFALSERTTEGWRIRDHAVALVRPDRLIGGDDQITVRRYLRFLRSGARVLIRRSRGLISRRTDQPTWVSGAFVDGLSSVIERGLPGLLLYGAEDNEYRDFLESMDGRVGRLLDRAAGSIDLRVLPGKVHGFTRTDGQALIVRTISDWVSRVAPLAPKARRTAVGDNEAPLGG